MNIDEIFVHPDWQYTTTPFDADIAILRTVSKITFTDNVKPVCLPSFDAPVYDVTGYVVGYGKSEENSFHETKPKHIRINSVTQSVCLFTDPIYAKLSSPRGFCAGEKNKNPCKGE